MDIDPQQAADGHPFPWRHDESDWAAAGPQIVTAGDGAAGDAPHPPTGDPFVAARATRARWGCPHVL